MVYIVFPSLVNNISAISLITPKHIHALLPADIAERF